MDRGGRLRVDYRHSMIDRGAPVHAQRPLLAGLVRSNEAIARVGADAGWPAPAASHRVQQVGG
jgi:hypothetical protein